MKISESWLREWANPDITTEILLDQLTMAGLEVEGIEAAGPLLDKVVIGEILSIEQHPDADKLRVCQVSNGSDTIAVVCGAPNARQGLKVAFAQVGAVLPGMKIKKAKLRGVNSFGMLCSSSELKLSEASNGILELPSNAPVGTSIYDYFQLNDTIIEVDLTPNRGDCLCVAGVAREVAAVNRVELTEINCLDVNATTDDVFSVELLASEACPHYVGRIIKDINSFATTPTWMQEKLRRCGLRPISPVVDVTNYVMMEIGQPMHGFDFDKLEGGIKVRMAKAGESFTLLDQSTVECRADTLVIADHQKPLALAGIMGGLDSSVQGATKNIFLEAAFFAPILLAGKARNYGMHTDSSHRFERGVDSQLQVKAINRATALLLEIVGGEAGPVIEAIAEKYMPQMPEIKLRYARIKRLLGIDVSKSEVSAMLKSLNMQVTDHADSWLVTAPSYRFDINIEADLIEEIGRMVGYNNIQGTKELAHVQMAGFSETQVALNQVHDVLVEQGFYQAITYSFVSAELQAILDPGQATLKLTNPISTDMSTMRTRLLPGLLQALQYNVNRQQSKVRLFETGLCFRPEAQGLQQNQHLAAVVTGARDDEGIHTQPKSLDFYDIKGYLESVMSLARGSEFRFSKTSNPILHPGQGADIYLDDALVGFVGCLHPAVLSKLNVSQPVYVFELELASILTAYLPKFTELSKYPSIRRDISLAVDTDVSAQSLIDCIRSVNSEILHDVFVFDVYTSKEMTSELKSVALGLILQDFSRTLVDEDVDKLIEKFLAQLKNKYNAVLREI
ncbi:MAG: phenylalanyl-tRNA synthetase beta chain [Gammaproteobacteria bacterium]|jgi:phenylalanyl-tRNA synthetase beta chain